MNAEQKKFLSERRRFYAKRFPVFLKLRRYLLEHGGTEVVINFLSSDEAKQASDVAEGVLHIRECRYGRRVQMAPGDPNSCHENIFKLFNEGKVNQGWTGWALSEDGLWRWHSWGSTKDGKIVETTVKRKLYAGFPYATHECSCCGGAS